ncbi:hypothetical protein B0J13DRAFT_173204 [Dactylonectria estremocensis]|uniref:CST complex subunit Stn1 N-terminal domain-containing protein n=1 Tax=Dactylonectria estremocensis TaxID=1079267 RepID=A0A9P9FC01_9HYPO|nr:hypothetical protein B0J13DRAFT_173204 [Dactylonectria estremocensis]
MANPPKPAIYPRYCFHLAPTVNSWCFLHATDVNDLEQHEGFEGEDFYFYKNLPIKWVRVVGVVVAIDELKGLRIFTVDDSSGACIQCTIPIPAPVKEGAAPQQEKGTALPTYAHIGVGSVVDVKGGISFLFEDRRITIEKMSVVKSTAYEVVLWDKRTRFRAEVLDKPWLLRSRDIRKCKQEAEQNEGKAERKRKRLKAMIEGRAAEQSAERPAEQPKAGTDEQPGITKSLDLRQILQQGGAGKYDALGL